MQRGCVGYTGGSAAGEGVAQDRGGTGGGAGVEGCRGFPAAGDMSVNSSKGALIVPSCRWYTACTPIKAKG